MVGDLGRTELAVSAEEGARQLFRSALAVGVTAYLTGYLASEYGLRPVPIYLGVAYAILRAALSILLVRSTNERRAEPSAVRVVRRPVTTWSQGCSTEHYRK